MSCNKFATTFNYTPLHWKTALTEIIAEKKISPIKVGYLVEIEDEKCIIAAVDWSKKECVISKLKDMNKYYVLEFKNLLS